jgi:uncharacterized membrane protein YbaN (DUF454 family)
MSNDDDIILPLLFTSPFIFPVITSFFAGSTDSSREWLLDRQLLAPAGEAIVEIPGWEGAGLIKAHFVIIACFFITVLVVLTVVVQHHGQQTDTSDWGGS